MEGRSIVKTSTRPTRLQIAFDLRRQAERYVGGTGLVGMCGICSWLLARQFQKYGYSAAVVSGTFMGNDHCWVLSGKAIWDITLTQFGEYLRVEWHDIGSRMVDEFQPEKVIRRRSEFNQWAELNQPTPDNTGWYKPNPLTIEVRDDMLEVV